MKNFDTQYNERWFSPIDRTLRRELKSKFRPKNIGLIPLSYKELIDLRIKYKNGYFNFWYPKDQSYKFICKNICSLDYCPSNYNGIISLIFLKNQTRPITNLARAAERFGKGEEIEEFKPIRCFRNKTSRT